MCNLNGSFKSRVVRRKNIALGICKVGIYECFNNEILEMN